MQNVVNSDGWEAWRILSRRFDPQDAGRKRNVASQPLQPGVFDPHDLNGAIAKWEEKIRMYERRAQIKLPDDNRSSILTEMTNGALKKQLVVSAAKLENYEGVREVIQR